jgi:hypothetical protein
MSNEQKPALIPDDSKKTTAVVMKILISVVAFAEAIFVERCAIADKPSTDEPSTGKKDNCAIGQSCFSIILTLLDFGFSCCCGYCCYSPMSPDKDYMDTDYAKKLNAVNTWSTGYTCTWIIKTVVSIAFDIGDIYAEYKQLDGKFTKVKTIVAGIIKTIIYAVSGVFEIGAIIAAALVDANNSSFRDEKIDKSIFICDTAGYLIDDIKSISDSLYDIFKDKSTFKPVYLTIRSMFACGYIVTSSVSAGMILEN